MIRLAYRTYQLLIAMPLILVASVLTSATTVVGCLLGNGHFWGYYPGKLWSRFICTVLLLPVRVEGREHLKPGQSYVFVANHQGFFDVFVVYGYLGRNFKWMMKQSLRKMPLVGTACAAAQHIYVDKRGASKIKATYEQARDTLRGGMSLVVFPEGARTYTGHLGTFRRGAFMLADELQLPVCPLTINGSFNVMPRMRDWHFVEWHPLRLTIHQPIDPAGQGADNVQATMRKAYDKVMQGLVAEYQGYEHNPDQ